MTKARQIMRRDKLEQYRAALADFQHAMGTSEGGCAEKMTEDVLLLHALDYAIIKVRELTKEGK